MKWSSKPDNECIACNADRLVKAYPKTFSHDNSGCKKVQMVQQLGFWQSSKIKLCCTKLHWPCQLDLNRQTWSPVMNSFTTKQLQAYISNPEIAQLADFPNFPCDARTIESCIRIVTQPAAIVCGQERRDEFICAQLIFSWALEEKNYRNVPDILLKLLCWKGANHLLKYEQTI